MADTEKVLRARYDKYSRWADRVAGLIIVGLAVDIVSVPVLGKPPLEAVFAIAANVLIIAGVWGEILLERRARAAGDGLVAEANARAAEAQLETERLKAQFGWRALSQDQRATLLNRLQIGKGSATFECALGDVESLNFATLLGRGFVAAGWDVGLVAGTYGSRLAFGIEIDPDSEVSGTIQSAFTAANIPFGVGFVAQTGFKHGREGGVGPSHCRVYVGPKTPPQLT